MILGILMSSPRARWPNITPTKSRRNHQHHRQGREVTASASHSGHVRILTPDPDATVCRHILCRVTRLQVGALTASYSVRFGGMVFD